MPRPFMPEECGIIYGPAPSDVGDYLLKMKTLNHSKIWLAFPNSGMEEN